MRPENVLLISVALLAALFFIGGLIDLFNGLRVDSPPRRRRRKRRPVPKVQADPQKESEAPALTSSPAAAPMAADLAWPARRSAPMSGESAESAPVEEFPPEEVARGKIVVHDKNGRLFKGYSYDFSPNKPHFHLSPSVARLSPRDEAVQVRIKDLKAVFFVKDFAGDPSYNERKCFAEDERPPGRKLEVKFSDGEMLVGSTMAYDRRRPGFFLIPADPKSNNLKVFAVSRAVTSVRFL